MEKKFTRNIETLDEVFSFVEQSCGSFHIDAALLFSINFVVEELFTNIVKYNKSGSQSDIMLSFEKKDGQLFIKLTDYDVDPFDVTQVADVDTSQSLEERKVGGLGVHLVRMMVDDIQYTYSNRESTITLIKNLG